MKQVTILKHRAVNVYALGKFMTSQSDDVLDITDYNVSQTLQIFMSLFYWQNIYFMKYVLL
jgi:hypothetical protein